MPEVSSSSLRRQMREEDPRRWLEWTLTELVEELEESRRDETKELLIECEGLLEAVHSWPRDMYPKAEAARMMARIDVIRRDLGEDDDVLARGGAADEEGTTYSITDAEAVRRRTGRPPRGDTDDEVPPATVSTAPPDRDDARARKTGRDRETSRESVTVLGDPSSADDERVSSSPPSPGPSDPPPRSLALRNPSRGAIARAEVEAIVERAPPRRSSLPPLGNYKIGRIIVEHLDENTPIDDRVVMVSDSRGAVAEAYRALFYRLGATTEARSIMIATTSEEEDSSVCAANLALAMALGSDERVLLIETRFKQPRLASLFSFQPSECFGRRLAKHRRDPEAPWRIAQLGSINLNLLALDPGQQTAPALDAQALDDVIQGFTDGGYRYVVVDGPPLTEDTDARFVARCVDGVVIAVHQGRSRQRQLRKALDLLDDVPVLGYVMVED